MDYLNAVSNCHHRSPLLNFITSTAKNTEEKSAVLGGHNDIFFLRILFQCQWSKQNQIFIKIHP